MDKVSRISHAAVLTWTTHHHHHHHNCVDLVAHRCERAPSWRRRSSWKKLQTGNLRRLTSRCAPGVGSVNISKCVNYFSFEFFLYFQVREAEIRKDVLEEKLQVKKEVKVEEKEESEDEMEDEDLEDFLDWRIKKLS